MSVNPWSVVTTRLRNSGLARWLRYDYTLIVYRRLREPQQQALERSPRVRRDDWAQLERFERTEHWLRRKDFLRTCEQRLAAGEHVYTIADDGRLLAYGWLVPHQKRSWFPAVCQELLYPAGAAVLYNAFTHPAARGRGLHTLVTEERIADAFQVFDADAAYTAVNTANDAARHVKHSTGMEPWLELSCRIRLGRTLVSRRPLAAGEGLAVAASAIPA